MNRKLSLKDLIAHSAPELGGEPQSLYDHAKNVAELAAQFAASFQSEDIARWLGWWHDAGKVHPDVQEYLTDDEATPPGPDHSSAGMLAAFEQLQPLAFNVAGHHGGLPDRSYLKDRVKRKQQEQRVVEALDGAKSLLAKHVPRLAEVPLPDYLQSNDEYDGARRLEFWLRMLHAALVDADCLDTAAHFDPKQATIRASETPSLSTLWARFEEDQTALLAKAENTPVNRARAEVYRACLRVAKQPPRIFSLTVPTGGGKTRSAMAFALQHALNHHQRRVIVALPYTSIIEQNVDVYRDIFGDPRAVLEHHSAVHAEERPGDESDEERWRRLAAENWDAPVVVTTTVQLLESLFTHRNPQCRKLHRIANSIIVLDEVQTLPPRLLEPTLDVLQHLVDCYGVTLVLCTATQPALVDRGGFEGLKNVREIIDEPERLYRTLQRVEYDLRADEPWTWERVAEAMQREPQAMVVLNTIRDAMAILDALEEVEHVFHLSTQLCGAHRREVLAEVRRRLDDDEPVHLVSTQVVEAGVDIDFPLVLRAMGPLDRIIQAAGRCNREGRREVGRVIVFEPADGHLPPEEYQRATDVTRTMIRRYTDLDLHDPTLPHTYFEHFYDVSNVDAAGIQDLRSAFKFEETSRAYRLIDDYTLPVVVPYRSDAVDDVVRQVRAKGHANRFDFRALQPYTVSLRHWAHQKAADRGLCHEVVPGIWRWDGRYDDLRGIQWDGPTVQDLVIA